MKHTLCNIAYWLLILTMVVAVVTASFTVVSLGFMWAWNVSFAALTPLPKVNFWRALAVVMLLQLTFRPVKVRVQRGDA